MDDGPVKKCSIIRFRHIVISWFAWLNRSWALRTKSSRFLFQFQPNFHTEITSFVFSMNIWWNFPELVICNDESPSLNGIFQTYFILFIRVDIDAQTCSTTFYWYEVEIIQPHIRYTYNFFNPFLAQKLDQIQSWSNVFLILLRYPFSNAHVLSNNNIKLYITVTYFRFHWGHVTSIIP